MNSFCRESKFAPKMNYNLHILRSSCVRHNFLQLTAHARQAIYTWNILLNSTHVNGSVMPAFMDIILNSVALDVITSGQPSRLTQCINHINYQIQIKSLKKT